MRRQDTAALTVVIPASPLAPRSSLLTRPLAMPAALGTHASATWPGADFQVPSPRTGIVVPELSLNEVGRVVAVILDTGN